ncbi:MAG: CDP-glycerol--glycerophosphate glycerophosphotransferase [Ignavibacteriae bacterium]|nr:CDP-glycerol--glycerophosphate glycerophosphotransferase [Ignavibacteriota bacterium]
MKKYLFFISQPYAFAILRPLQEEIKKRGDDVSWYFDGPGAKYLRDDEKQIHTIEEVIKYNPRAVFTSSNIVFDFFPGVKVQMFHGFSVNKRSEEKGHYRIRGLFDLYFTQGPDTTIHFQQLSKKHKYFKVAETGWTKLDPYFTSKIEKKKNERPTIIYTSTFTKRLTSAPILFDTIKAISRNNKWEWIVTFHPRMDNEIIQKYKSIQNENLTFIETDNLIPHLLNADVMVSDTSSIISEFLVLQKPVITFRNNKPGPYFINTLEVDKLESNIDLALSQPDQLMKNIIEYSNFIHPYRDGNSSKRVLDATEYFIENEFDNMPSKPLNLFRKFKMRKRVRYFKL